MIATNADSQRRLSRDADRAMLGGVCAGLAAYLGLNLKVTRILAFIAFLMAMPIAVFAYLAAVYFIPSNSNSNFEVETRGFGQRICGSRKARRARKDSEPAAASGRSAAADIDRRCRSLDERLVRLEKLVTSRRFQLEQELSRL